MKQEIKDKLEWQVEEYIRCKNDFEYYATHYVYLELAGGDVLYCPYQKQLEFIRLVQKEKSVVCLKTRQTGISTTTQAYCSWLLLFHDNTVCGILSKDGKEATDFSRAIRNMIEKVPGFLTPKKGREGGCFDKKSEQSFILSNGSKLFVATVNPIAPEKTLRGKAVTFLVIDEAAFINKLDIAWTSLVPALSTAQKQARKAGVPYGTLIISTPNKTMGMGAWFYSRYTKAISSEGIFKPCIVYWRDIPELANDPTWFKSQCEMFDNDNKKIEQELELKFLPSGGSFFDEKTCLTLQDNTKNIDPIEIFKLFNGEIWKYQNPIPGKHYIIGVDTAPEFGEDKSAITIWDYETLEQVWEYQTKCKVLDFVKVVKYAIAQYNGTVVIENNSYGNQVMESINDSEFSVMMYKEKRGESKIVPGLSNNTKTRPLMIDALYSYVTQYPQMVKSKRLALELIGLVSKNTGKVEADSGCHDDLALTLSFCMYVRKYDPPLFIDNNTTAQNVFNNILDMNNSDSAIKFLDNAEIIKHVKENVFSYDDALVNTLSLYHRG